MTEFPVHSLDSAPEGSQAPLTAVKSAYGFIPNLMGVFAESPAATKAYLAVQKAFSEDTALSAPEQQVVLLAASVVNRCHYCVAAHSAVALSKKTPQDVVEAIRESQPIAEAKLEALRVFTQKIVEKRGWLDESDIDAFLAAGYAKRHVLDVLVGVTQKTLSNYTNHIAETELDKPFEAHAWTQSEPANV